MVGKSVDRRVRLGVGLVLVAMLVLLATLEGGGPPSGGGRSGGAASEVTSATRTPEPLVPTRTRVEVEGDASSPLARDPAASVEVKAAQQPSPSATIQPTGLTATPVRVEQPSPTPPPTGQMRLPQGKERFGAGVVAGPITLYPIEDVDLGLGWYLDWWVRENPPRPGGADYWQMVQISEEGYGPDATTLRAVASANPGSFWIIGNEPDVRWQNNTTPERYAELYHDLYHLLKDADPTCQVVIGGISQPTPLRLAYLERVLSAYRERYSRRLPVDVWNVHGFILREDLDSWGVDIPPGLDAEEGRLYDIDDHDNLEIFATQIRAFRRWMAEKGEREKPLVVSEYGVLMPADFGFDRERVQAFMEGSFDFLLGATDEEIGYPADGNRLVQWWCWYSLAAPADYYPTGNLFDPETRSLTPLGLAFRVRSRP